MTPVSAIATRRRPPGPRIGPIAAGRAFLHDPITLLTEAATHGDVAYFRGGPFRVFVVSHPDLVKHVLVTRNRDYHKGQGLQETKRLLGEGLLTSEDEFHRKQRRTIQPIFHHGRIDGYGAAMVEPAERAGEWWQDGSTIDIHAEMSRLTLAIVGRTLFATNVDDRDAREVSEALSTTLRLFDRLFGPFVALREHLPLPSTRRLKAAREALDRTIYDMIDQRLRDGADGEDLLSLLLRARDTEGDGEGMSREQVRDEAMTIFLAGHETTAVALTWAWYLLAKNTVAEARLHAELDAVLGDRPPAVEDIPRLRYTGWVLREAMRLYPPAWVLGRKAVVETEVGGYPVPPEALVVTSQWVVHHDERWWPDPFAFRPERWAEEEADERPRYAYFPFGAGPRICIGEGFAWMEGTLLLAALARRWAARVVPGHTVGLQPRITLRPRDGIRVTLHRRPG